MRGLADGWVLTLAVLSSGFAGLAYQVAWTRQLVTLTSATTLAQATVLSVFMAGLGIGAWLAARFAHRVSRPLLVYGLCELAAVPLAVGAMPLVRLSTRFVPGLVAVDPGVGVYWFQIGLLGAYLLLPVTLLGMSLPLVIEHIERLQSAGATPRRGIISGVIYGFNTIGAAAGAMAAGFVLMERFGLTRTAMVGGAFGIASAVLAVVLSVGRPLPPREAAGERDRLEARWVVAAALSGAAGLAAEVVWTRLMLLVVMNTVYAFTQVLVAVLVGVALGGVLAAAVVRKADGDRREAVLRLLVLMQCGVAVLTSAVPWVVLHVGTWGTAFADVARGRSALSGLVLLGSMVAPAALSAAVMPLLAACSRLRHGSRAFGQMYAANTVGCVLGSLSGGFLLLPALGSHGAILVVSLASLGVAALVMRDVSSRGLPMGVMAGAALASVLAWLSIDIPGDVYRARVPAGTRVLEIHEGASSDVVVTEDENGWRRLWINSVWVAGTGGRHRLLGHLPALMVAEPRRVLGIALGTGQTFGTVFRHGVEHLDCVEIDSGVIGLSRRWFGSFNGHVFDAPGAVLHHADGRAFLRGGESRYDIIVLEPLQAWSAGTSSLYSVEFYREARARLAPEGVVAQWIPLYGQGVMETRAMVRSAIEVFPRATLWLDGHDGILLLSAGSAEVGAEDLRQRIAARGIRGELEADHAHELHDLLGLFMAGEAGLRAWTEGIPLLRDDHPFLEFAAARSLGENVFPAIVESMIPHLGHWAGCEPEVCRKAAAVRHALLSAAVRPEPDYVGRADSLERGLAQVPESNLVAARYRMATMAWAASLEASGHGEEAVAVYRRALRHDPEFAEAAVNLAVLEAGAGRFDRARAALESVRSVDRTRTVVEAMLRSMPSGTP